MLGKLSGMIRKAKKTTCSVVVLAAGSSERMGQDKLFLELAGEPVLGRTLRVLNDCSFVSEIVVVTREDRLEKVADLCHVSGFSKVRQIVVGG